MATITITGGTGLIGQALTKSLISKGHKVIILTRHAQPADGNTSYAEWNIDMQLLERKAIEDADYIIHLAGANVAEKRWTKKQKQVLIDSRVRTGHLIVKGLKEIPNKVKAVISASGMGWYGPDTANNKNGFTENDPEGNDFLGYVVKHWEEAIEPVKELGKRLVIYRMGIVLSEEGGAFDEFYKPLKFRTATILGSGKQIVSWLHIDDAVRLYEKAIEDETMHGIYNAAAPNSVTNKDLIKTIAKQNNKAHLTFPVPSFVLKAVLGEMSVEVLKSTTLNIDKLASTGFRFQYDNIDDAVRNLLSRK